MPYTRPSAPQLRKRLKLPASHRQQQRVAFAVFVGDLLIGLVLLRKVLRHALRDDTISGRTHKIPCIQNVSKYPISVLDGAWCLLISKSSHDG